MTKHDWKRSLKKALKRITEREIWEYDPDAPHHRIKGAFGREERVFNKKFDRLFICFDISGSPGFSDHYVETLEYIDSLYRPSIGRRFKRIHLHYFAQDGYTAEPFRIKRPVLAEEAKKNNEKASENVNTGLALASAMTEPFNNTEVWAKLKPDLMLIFTKGCMKNDLSTDHYYRLRKYRKQIIWLCFSENWDIDDSIIKEIDPLAERRTIQIINDQPEVI